MTAVRGAGGTTPTATSDIGMEVRVRRRYVTADVFTTRVFGGNPVAVVLDACGLSVARMQAVASEFNYSETAFVLPSRDPSRTA